MLIMVMSSLGNKVKSIMRFQRLIRLWLLSVSDLEGFGEQRSSIIFSLLFLQLNATGARAGRDCEFAVCLSLLLACYFLAFIKKKKQTVNKTAYSNSSSHSFEISNFSNFEYYLMLNKTKIFIKGEGQRLVCWNITARITLGASLEKEKHIEMH